MTIKEVYLIDGSTFIYRAFHAIGSLTNAQGMQTNAVFGFVSIVRRLFNERKPAFVAVAFDSRGPVFRHELYADYKANRPPMPDELAEQIPYIKEAVTALGITSFEQPGVEADDLIASAVRRLDAAGQKVIIVSGDKDLLQLVNDRVIMWDPMNDRLMDAAAVADKYQVVPARLLDCFALIGDSSDNVPGVPGVGVKTAAALIGEYATLENLYDNLDTLSQKKTRERLREYREQAFLSRDLIRLKDDIEVSSDVADYAPASPDPKRLRELYVTLGFNSLLKELDSSQPIPDDGFILVAEPAELGRLGELWGSAEQLAIDTETTSIDSRIAELVGVSVATSAEQCWYLPIAHRDATGARVPGQLSLEQVRHALAPLFKNSSPALIGHNLKYDLAVLRNTLNLVPHAPLVDTMIAAHLAEPSRRSLKLDDICRDRGFELTPYTAVTRGDKRDDAFAYTSIEEACAYSCEDVYGALMLWHHFQPILTRQGQMELFATVETPLIKVLVAMEEAGIGIDTTRLAELEREFSDQLAILEKEIYKLAGRSFNINSPSQLAVVLFDELGLPRGRKTKTGYSTDARVLEKLALEHELPARIIRYRNFAKLLSTYVESLGALIDPHTGRVHTSFNQTVTATGRLSSTNPNLQNIPIRGEDGHKIREAFVPAPGALFLFADYSQIDLRVLAHYSGDEALTDAFRHGEDIHTRTAAQIFGVNPAMVTTDMRRAAKSINFGIVYGMSSYGLSVQLGISRSEAARFIDRYFEVYRGVREFMEHIVRQARDDGYVSTLLGRRRYLPEIGASNKTRREFAERAAINTPIQGTAADIMKVAMLAVYELLADHPGCKMVLQIHDELVFELDEATRALVQEPIQQAMEGAVSLTVPLVVNVSTGLSLAKE
ncbi:MAG: DNA polymerase I [Desulfofustis sp. PB-SRB1]|nr:DNA polymerase I [Desulfofustis sp. PB-SRB1]MBM1002839.1 DNA polymerase I [Desulfofustis sp. PB-SRB1]HBH29726.1 DNA polymerase I [Desulfofustis sp.]HBH31242.1 DNA polymerase I [Desulfofustis sp.]